MWLKGCGLVKGSETMSLVLTSERTSEVWTLKANSQPEFDELFKVMDEAINPKISDPSVDGKVKHVTHVAVDGEHGYVGLPSEWEKLLQMSKIDVSSTPVKQIEAVMQVHDALINGRELAPVGRAKELPQEFNFSLRDLVSPQDPSTLYTGERKQVWMEDHLSNAKNKDLKSSTKVKTLCVCCRWFKSCKNFRVHGESVSCNVGGSKGESCNQEGAKKMLKFLFLKKNFSRSSFLQKPCRT
jgi:hypothetical protein